MIFIKMPKNKKKIRIQRGFTIIELMISTVVFSLVLLAASAAIIQIGKKYYKGITNARTQEVARSTVDEIAQSLQFTNQSIKVPNYPNIDAIPGPDVKYNIYNLLFPSQLSSGPDVIISDTNIVTSVPDTFYFCIGTKRYSFVLNKQINDTNPHAFWIDEPEVGCANAVAMGPAALNQADPSNSPVYPANNGRELLDKNMRITKLSIAPKSNGLWTIDLSLASGENDLMLYTYNSVTGQGRISCEGSLLGSEFCATSEISVNVSKRIQ